MEAETRFSLLTSHFKSPHAWKSTNSRLANKPAGTLKADGYIAIYLDGKARPAHRLIWIYHFGDIPEGMEIDHINRDRADNRITNLRLATRADNARNLNQRNPTKPNGVTWKPKRKRWQARITIRGKVYHLGYFTDFASAIVARKQAEEKHAFAFQGASLNET